MPLEPRGEPVTTYLDVPRLGRSPEAVLYLPMLAELGRFEGRLVLLHGNRVLQTCVLTGEVDGDPVRVTERISLWDRFEDLDDRRAFDQAFVLNHDDSGAHGIHTFAGDRCETIGTTGEIDSIIGRIRDLLIEAADASTSKARTRMFVLLAGEGSNLHRALRGYFKVLQDPHRIQVVAARPSWMLPLEFVYNRTAPEDDAVLCRNWTAKRACGPHCFSDEDDDTIVCPSVFWGMSRVIERYYVDADSEVSTVFHVGGANPSRQVGHLVSTPAALGASSLVTDRSLGPTLKALGGIEAAADWKAWAEALKSNASLLLALMPHTDELADTMEIAGVELRGALIKRKYVTAGVAGRFPVVVLFGCDTAGFERNPAGFAARFLQSDAAVVFATMTMLSVVQAPKLCVRLAALLQDQGRGVQTVGEFVAAYRRDCVRAGLLTGLSVTALGNSDWTI